jgi:hypothetical protein
MPSPLPRQVGGSCSLIIFPFIGLPQVRGGSAPASWFSRLAQRSLTLRPARLQSRLHDPFTSEASAALLPPPLLRLLPGRTNQFPGGTCTHCGLNAFSRRTRTIPLRSGTHLQRSRQPAVEKCLVRRSQRAPMRWERITPVSARWIPPPPASCIPILILASTPLILRKSRMRKRARTDLSRVVP